MGIKEKTVLILGAGASMPYGFPSGGGLRKKIIRDFKSEIMHSEQFHNVIRSPNFENILDDFIHDFDLSSDNSIDLFLSRNRKYEDIGKMAIAHSIFKCEQTSDFNERAYDAFHYHQNGYGNWYSFLFHKITEEMISDFSSDKLSENNISIITFNYDRSLEYYLNQSIYYSFENLRKKPISWDYLTFPIYHVYGSLGQLQTIPYGKNATTIFSIETLSQNIKTIYQERDTIPGDMLSAIKQADKVLFLGFGYYTENLSKLQSNEWDVKNCYGTKKGISNKEMVDALKKISGSGPDKINYFKDIDSYDFLRDFL